MFSVASLNMELLTGFYTPGCTTINMEPLAGFDTSHSPNYKHGTPDGVQHAKMSEGNSPN
jgi:hypothetical protein